MGHSKLSVTIPDDVYDQINEFASKEKIKLSHLVAEALVEKLRFSMVNFRIVEDKIEVRK